MGVRKGELAASRSSRTPDGVGGTLPVILRLPSGGALQDDGHGRHRRTGAACDSAPVAEEPEEHEQLSAGTAGRGRNVDGLRPRVRGHARSVGEVWGE